MSFIPEVISPEYSLIDGKKTFLHIRDYKFPADKTKIAGLTLAEKQVWYAAQDPHAHIESGEDFSAFWYWHYIVPLKLKRFVFWFKFW